MTTTTSATITVDDAHAAHRVATGFVREEFTALNDGQLAALGAQLPLLTAALATLAQAGAVLDAAIADTDAAVTEKVKATMRAVLRDLAENGGSPQGGTSTQGGASVQGGGA